MSQDEYSVRSWLVSILPSGKIESPQDMALALLQIDSLETESTILSIGQSISTHVFRGSNGPFRVTASVMKEMNFITSAELKLLDDLLDEPRFLTRDEETGCALIESKIEKRLARIRQTQQSVNTRGEVKPLWLRPVPEWLDE
jgi:hypothetical protein